MWVKEALETAYGYATVCRGVVVLIFINYKFYWEPLLCLLADFITEVLIRKSVDSLCRNGTDAQYM